MYKFFSFFFFFFLFVNSQDQSLSLLDIQKIRDYSHRLEVNPNLVISKLIASKVDNEELRLFSQAKDSKGRSSLYHSFYLERYDIAYQILQFDSKNIKNTEIFMILVDWSNRFFELNGTKRLRRCFYSNETKVVLQQALKKLLDNATGLKLFLFKSDYLLNMVVDLKFDPDTIIKVLNLYTNFEINFCAKKLFVYASTLEDQSLFNYLSTLDNFEYIRVEDLKLGELTDSLLHGFDFGSLNDYLKTKLFKSKNDYEVVKILLDNGVDPNSKDSVGNTLLMRLIIDSISRFGEIPEQTEKAIKLLLDRNVNVSCKNGREEDVLQIIMRKINSFEVVVNLELIKQLIDLGFLILEHGGDPSHFRVDFLKTWPGLVTQHHKKRLVDLWHMYYGENNVKDFRLLEKSVDDYQKHQSKNNIVSKLSYLFGYNPDKNLLNKINFSSLSNLGVLQRVIASKLSPLSSDSMEYKKLRIALLTIAKKTAQYVFALDKLLNKSENLPLDIIDEIVFKCFSKTIYVEVVLKSGQKTNFIEMVRYEYQKMNSELLSKDINIDAGSPVGLHQVKGLRQRKFQGRDYQSLLNQE